MRHDSLSDALIIIKNADHVGKDSAVVPASRLIGDVLKQLTEKELLALNKAKEILGDSFNIIRSIGFIKWCKNK